MEINYCRECHSRVSSVDIEAGKGLTVDGTHYCDDCAKKKDLYKQAAADPPANRTTQTTGAFRRSGSNVNNRKPGSSPKRTAQGGRRRSGSSSMRDPVQGTSRRPRGEARPAAGGNTKNIVIIMIIVILLLIVLIAVLSRKPASSGQPQNSSAPAPVPDTIPERIADASVPPLNTEPVPITASPVPTGPIKGKTYIYLEAEFPDIIAAPMEIAPGTKTSGPGYIRVLDNTAASGSGGYAQYSIDLPHDGKWYLHGRALTHGGEADSFYIELDGQGRFPWFISEMEKWGWDRVNNNDTGEDPVVFNLKKGKHTLTVHHREDGTYLDKIMITDDSRKRAIGKEQPVINSQVKTDFIIDDNTISSALQKPREIPARDGWGSGKALNLTSGKKWSRNGSGKVYKDGASHVLRGYGLDVGYIDKLINYRLEMQLEFRNAQSWEDMLAVYLQKQAVDRNNDGYRVVLFYDGTINLWRFNEKVEQHNNLWDPGSIVDVVMTVTDTAAAVSINGHEVFSHTVAAPLDPGGFVLGITNKAPEAEFVFHKLNLYLAE